MEQNWSLTLKYFVVKKFSSDALRDENIYHEQFSHENIQR